MKKDTYRKIADEILAGIKRDLQKPYESPTAEDVRSFYWTWLKEMYGEHLISVEVTKTDKGFNRLDTFKFPPLDVDLNLAKG